MASTLAPPFTPAAPRATVRPLEPSDVPALRLYGLDGERVLRESLEIYPSRSVWVPETREYALIGRWRNRAEIASVDELVAVRNAETLLRAAFERCVEHGDDLLLAVELESPRGRSRYERAGLEMLEEVITYEIAVSRSAPPPAALHRYRVDFADNDAIDRVLAIDETAFPWLWRNSRTEFDDYLRTPGVEVSLIEYDGRPVAYLGMTRFLGWGHLDRIAVSPDAQGQGFGRAALALAIEDMRQQGAKRVALSTQRTNRRSQRMYERFGFRRTPDLDYKLYGAWRQPGAHGVRSFSFG
jgi:ribosomal protein S18 acetylase RimI-like enzyme